MTNSASRRIRTAALVVAALPLEAFAHPGHEDHDVTWDFGHLAEHPVATLGCFLVIGAGAWAAWRLAKQNSAPAANKSADATHQRRRTP